LALLTLTNVSKHYPAPAGVEPVRVLRDVTLAVDAGESVALVGPSGSGKSTLLNIIGTLDRPTAGQVMLDNRDLLVLQDDELTTLRNREIGFIFQAHHLLPQCSVLENVLVPTLAGGAELREGAEDRARLLLELLGLATRLTHRPGQLSGGECQRVAVVRALINRPKLLLADEPTGALDRVSSQNLSDMLVEINRELGVTLLAVTHSLDLAMRMGRVLELDDGLLGPRKVEALA